MMVLPKRQFVLYAFLAAGVVLIAGLGWWHMHGYLSFIREQKELREAGLPPTATSTQTGATMARDAMSEPVIPFEYEIVASPAAMMRGLSGRADIPHDYGMLFVFARPDRYGIWMKDMLTPIDILWLSDNGLVVHVEEHVSPQTYPGVFKPPVPALYVLETRAGEAARKGWTVGSAIDLPLPYGK